MGNVSSYGCVLRCCANYALAFIIKCKVVDTKKGVTLDYSLPSNSTYEAFQDAVAVLFGIHPSLLVIGWKRSTDRVRDFPTKIISGKNLLGLVEEVKDSYVPPLTQAGVPRKVKPIIITLHNLNDGTGGNSADGGGKAKVWQYTQYPLLNSRLTLTN